MPQQPGNPPSKPVSKDSGDSIPSMQEATAALNKVNEEFGKIGELGKEIFENLNMRSELSRLLTEMITLEHNPDLKSQLASKKEELEKFLKQHNLEKKVSYDTLKREVLEPKKRWQFWRSQAAADLIHPS